MSDKKIIHVALACDNNYVFYCAETIVSILINTRNSDIFYYFYILQENLSALNKERILQLKNTIKDCSIEFIEIDTNEIEAMKNPMCFRLKLASLLPNLDKIIYTDCDVTFLDSLEEIWDENIEEYYSGNCIDFKSYKKRNIKYYKKIFHNYENNLDFDKYDVYYNSGFMIMNLKKIRKDKIEEKLMNFIKMYPDIDETDQNAINIVYYDKIKPISFRWSFLISYYTTKKYKIRNKKLIPDLKDSAKHPKMIHFVGDKKPTIIYKSIFHPFSYGIVNKYKKLFWNYVAMTDWKDEKKCRVIYKFPINFLNKED